MKSYPILKDFTTIPCLRQSRFCLYKASYRLQQTSSPSTDFIAFNSRDFGFGFIKFSSRIGDLLQQSIFEEKEDEEPTGLLASLMSGFRRQNVTSCDLEKFLRDTIPNLMIARRDTISTALSWFFYLLAQNPSVENKTRKEIENKTGGGKWKTLSINELEGLVYLHGGIYEALRLYPPIGLGHKAPVRADVLPTGHVVDKEISIILSFYSMERMEGLWGDDCMEFKPERWFSKGGNGIRHEPSYKFPAFHVGPFMLALRNVTKGVDDFGR